MKYHMDGSIPAGREVFVFGSNLAGIHGAGAASVASHKFGARWGRGMGRWGASYAIPTKDRNLHTLPIDDVRGHIHRFIDYAIAHPEEEFFITRIGCGLAGFKDRVIAPLFGAVPANCSVAYPWRPYLEDVLA